jgi:multidrug efflux system membrane fusion protein
VVKEDNTVETRPIATGNIAEGRAVIVAGLTGGEIVVISGQNRLQPGSRVEITTTSDMTSPLPASLP